MEDHPGLLSTKDAAPRCGVKPPTMDQWRYLNKGPRWIRVSARAIRYRPEDIDAWLAARERGGDQREGRTGVDA